MNTESFVAANVMALITHTVVSLAKGGEQKPYISIKMIWRMVEGETL